MKNKIGIIGGSGALATSFLLKKINEYSIDIHKSITDRDFLNTVTISSPFTNLDFKGNFHKDTFNNLLTNMHQLEDINCNVIVIACNTLHAYWEQLNNLRKNESTILLNLPKIVTSFIEKDEKKIGVLCSQHCRELNIYETFLKENNKTILYPTMEIQNAINHCINSVIKNDNQKQFKHLLDISLYSLFEQGVDSVILGCSELSILKPLKMHSNIYDSVDLLAIFLNQNFKD